MHTPPQYPTSLTDDAWKDGFPAYLTITGNFVTESIIADIPFYSVGILAIGVATFLFVMRRVRKHISDILLATFLAFIAAILDLGQLVLIGSTRSASGPGITPLRVARELGYAVSFGMRFLFFWRFVAMPPRGEVSASPTPARASQTSRDEFHSGSWTRLGLTGVVARYALLIGVVAVAVTQVIWRLSTNVSHPAYMVDSIVQVVLSSLLLLKLAVNISLCPLVPRWRTIGDYLPVATAIAIGLGVAIGNLICTRFSESPLGRFLQAIELYIVIIYVLIAAFHNISTRTGIVINNPDNERSRANSSFVDVDISNPARSPPFGTTPPDLSAADAVASRELEAAGTNGIPSRLLLSNQPGARTSTTGRLANWIQNRLSGRPMDPQAYSNLIRSKDAEKGQTGTFDYNDQRSFSEASMTTPIKPREYGKQDVMFETVQTPPTGTSTTANDASQFVREPKGAYPVTAAYTPAVSYAPAESEPVGPNPRRAAPSTVVSDYSLSAYLAGPTTTAANAPIPPLNLQTLPGNPRPRNPGLAPVPEPASPVDAADPDRESFGARNRPPSSGEESPIYGLEGIIASLGGYLAEEESRSQRTTRADSKTYSPGAASFLRRQAELEQSVADLRPYSPNGTIREPYGLGITTAPYEPPFGQESMSLESEFSLSNFPSPPVAMALDPTPPQRTSIASSQGEVDLDDIGFTLIPPRMPAAASDGRQVSFPSTTRGSDLLQSFPRIAANSNGTQWDVTSFIGDSETSAGVAHPDSQGRPLSFPPSQVMGRDTMDTQELTAAIEALSIRSGSPDFAEEDSSVQDARIVDLRRAGSLGRARIVDGPVTAGSVNSANAQEQSVPASAERVAALRQKYKGTLPSSPRPARTAQSPNSGGRPPPLGVEAEPASTVSKSQSPTTSPQAQTNGQPVQIIALSLPPRPTPSSNVVNPPRVRNLPITGPVERLQDDGALVDGAFERPRPAPLVLGNAPRATSPPARAV